MKTVISVYEKARFVFVPQQQAGMASFSTHGNG